MKYMYIYTGTQIINFIKEENQIAISFDTNLF